MLQDIAGAAPAADGLVKDVTTQSFMKDVIEESKRQPVLVDFWAEWCGPCKQLTPVLEKAVKGAKGKVKLAKMDIDKHPAIPGQMGIQSIPAVIAFVNGQPADGFLGALPEGQVADFIARITKDKLGGEAQDFLKSAEEALAAGNADEAIALYGEVLREEPGSVRRSPVSRAPMWKPARSIRRKRRSRWCRRQSATTPRSRPRARRSKSPSRHNPSARSASLNKKLPRTRSIIRRGSTSRSRSMPRASGRTPPIIFSKSSSATANGTMTARASSWCSCSRPGAPRTRRP